MALTASERTETKNTNDEKFEGKLLSITNLAEICDMNKIENLSRAIPCFSPISLQETS